VLGSRPSRMKRGVSTRNHPIVVVILPSRKLTYPTWGKGKSSSNMPFLGDMLVPWRVILNISYIFPGIPVNWWKNIEKTVLKDMLNFMNLILGKSSFYE